VNTKKVFMTNQQAQDYVLDRYNQQAHGMISRDEYTQLLSEQAIHGAFNEGSGWIGYDYNNQQWIEV